MSIKTNFRIGIIGNPNSGKSSLFNFLTGLKQDVSNFPGVTIDKRSGTYITKSNQEIELIDLPGTYSVFPNSIEEKIVINILTNESNPFYPDLIVYVADITQLERHLLFATQLIDLGFPMIFVLNMADLVEGKVLNINTSVLSDYLQSVVLVTSVRNGINLITLAESIDDNVTNLRIRPEHKIYELPQKEKDTILRIKEQLNLKSTYLAKLDAHHYQWLSHLTNNQKTLITGIIGKTSFIDIRSQVEEIMERYRDYGPIVKQTVSIPYNANKTATDKIDKWITNRFFGPIFFFAIMLFVFQSIFNWAKVPMDIIEKSFVYASSHLNDTLPASWFSDLITNGLLPGLAGVLVFIPQIAILFFLIAILEETGYMSRVVYMFDGLLQKFGMNGRSMVSLISSAACAIPAIMSARTISNPKERLITIMVSPLISCSARLPVYAVLIGFVVPSTTVFGFLNAQGLAFMGLYLLGILAVLVSGYIFKFIIKSESPSFLMMELPNYKPPLWKNVFITVKEKVFSFIGGAGKIIVFISIILWFLASFGPGNSLKNAEKSASVLSDSLRLSQSERNNLIAAYRLEESYIGKSGKLIEPLISPLGFDWKIGIAIITSFAAREVFVGTMSTIYSIGSDNDTKTVREKMADEIRPGTNQKLYDVKTSMALLVFYVFAMQCMSTLAITKKETNSWKWPIVQFLFMGALAYMGSYLAYHIF
ncbi:MAG: ferrous iron transport protein B [Saprospiraceae bacterium]|nr:ferrous iron transport protein B [Saprospiraceae bacterium]